MATDSKRSEISQEHPNRGDTCSECERRPKKLRVPHAKSLLVHFRKLERTKGNGPIPCMTKISGCNQTANSQDPDQSEQHNHGEVVAGGPQEGPCETTRKCRWRWRDVWRFHVRATRAFREDVANGLSDRVCYRKSPNLSCSHFSITCLDNKFTLYQSTAFLSNLGGTKIAIREKTQNSASNALCGRFLRVILISRETSRVDDVAVLIWNKPA